MTIVFDPAEPAIGTETYGDRVIERLTPAIRLTWLDQGLHEAQSGASVQPFMRSRDFKHLGGAIAWARRRIFHGHVFGDVIEVVKVDRHRVNGVYDEDLHEAQDITLAGFLPWTEKTGWDGSFGVVLSSPNKRCVFS